MSEAELIHDWPRSRERTLEQSHTNMIHAFIHSLIIISISFILSTSEPEPALDITLTLTPTSTKKGKMFRNLEFSNGFEIILSFTNPV